MRALSTDIKRTEKDSTLEINAGQSGHRGWGKIEQHGPLLKALDFLQTFFDYEQLHPRTMDSCTDFSDLPCRTVG